MCSYNQGLGLPHVPMFPTGIFLHALKVIRYMELLHAGNIWLDGFLACCDSCDLFFQTLFYSRLLYKPMISIEISSSPNGQVKSSTDVNSKSLQALFTCQSEHHFKFPKHQIDLCYK